MKETIYLGEKFYTAPELGRLFRMSARTSVEKINQWAAAGKIRAYKVGRHWLFKHADVEMFLRKRCNA